MSICLITTFSALPLFSREFFDSQLLDGSSCYYSVQSRSSKRQPPPSQQPPSQAEYSASGCASTIAIVDSLTICEKDSDSSGDGDQENHDSIRASRSQNQACIQNSQNDDAPIFVGGPEEISDVGEWRC